MPDSASSVKKRSYVEPKFIKYGCLSIGLAGMALCGAVVLSAIIIFCMMIPHCGAFLLFHWLATTFTFSLPITVAAAFKVIPVLFGVISGVFPVSLGFFKPHSKIRTAINASWRSFVDGLKGALDFILMRGKIKRLTEERDAAIRANEKNENKLKELQERNSKMNDTLQKHDASILELRQECANKRWFIGQVNTMIVEQKSLQMSCLGDEDVRCKFYNENVAQLYKNTESEGVIKKLIADHKDDCFVYLGTKPLKIEELTDNNKWLSRMNIKLPDGSQGIGSDIPDDLAGVLNLRNKLNDDLITTINELIFIRQRIYLTCLHGDDAANYRKELNGSSNTNEFFSTPCAMRTKK